uniref:histidine kinase n=1 Tax=uncultured bacterium contig00034 TaxID=1181523 RepID=A0A806JYR5_9BACT|nr:two-component system hybrid sensor histidine kinase/response regulator protein [uncultured bacterium contig00034]
MRIVALDSGRLVYANNAALVIFRAASFEDVAGRNAFEFMPEVQPDGRTSEEIVIEMNKTEVASAEFVCNRMDGDTFVARITSRTIMYAGRLCSLATIEDMTEEKAYHEMLERTAQMEKEANSLKSRFLATMSHEIRTPLNAILGVAEIQLQKKNLPPDTEDAFLRIYESGDLLVNIVNDILDLSKIEAGKLEIVPVRYDLRGLVSDAAQFNRIRYENKPIELDVRVSEGTPAGLIGDELRIRQILNNILSNAFKYTDEGCIALNVSSEPAPDGVVLIFEVSDTGQGMSVSQQERLFDEYTRFNTDVNRSILGAGLGMGITKRLLELMNGEITVRSEPRKGSAFTIRIPQGLAGDGACGAELSDMLGASRFRKASVIKKRSSRARACPI